MPNIILRDLAVELARAKAPIAIEPSSVLPVLPASAALSVVEQASDDPDDEVVDIPIRTIHQEDPSEQCGKKKRKKKTKPKSAPIPTEPDVTVAMEKLSIEQPPVAPPVSALPILPPVAASPAAAVSPPAAATVPVTLAPPIVSVATPVPTPVPVAVVTPAIPPAVPPRPHLVRSSPLIVGFNELNQDETVRNNPIGVITAEFNKRGGIGWLFVGEILEEMDPIGECDTLFRCCCGCVIGGRGTL